MEITSAADKQLIRAQGHDLSPLGAWRGAASPAYAADDVRAALARVREPVHLVRSGPHAAVGLAQGTSGDISPVAAKGDWQWLASLPALYPEWLGDRTFCSTHRLRFPYLAGEMANGIATTAMVTAMASSTRASCRSRRWC